MPQAIPIFGYIGGYAAATISAATGLSLLAAATLIDTVLINIALGLVSKALGPKSAGGNRAPINVTVRGTTVSRSVILGTTRAGGSVVFYGCSGTNNKYLHYVVAYAGHQCNAVKDIWLENLKILDANINAGTGAVTQAPLTGKLNIWRYLGTSTQSADATLVAAFPGKWTSSFQLKGIAYAHIRMERDDSAYPQGPPNSVTAKVEGAKLYDPRLDSTNGGSGSHRYTDATTWAYSNNAALALRWILTGGSVTTNVATPLVKYGLKDSNARIDDSYVIAAANLCDESLTGAYTTPAGDQLRYTHNQEHSCGEALREWIEDALSSMAGTCFYVNGKWRMYAGAYDSPVHTITDADIYGDIQITDTSSHEDRYNANAKAYLAKLQALDEDFAAGLTSCTLHAAVTSHAAFAYLGKQYGFTQIPIAGLSPDAEPAAGRLAEIAEQAKAAGVHHIFFETLVSPQLAQTIAREIGADTLVFNPLEGLTPDEIAAGKNYFSVMRDNLSHLRTALQCK